MNRDMQVNLHGHLIPVNTMTKFSELALLYVKEVVSVEHEYG